MKRLLLIVAVLLVSSLMLPLAALATDSYPDDDILYLQTTSTDQPVTVLSELTQNNILNQLLAQEVTYQLDSSSTLIFSGNVASLAGKVELVVRF